MHDANDDSRRSRLISALWSLKVALEKFEAADLKGLRFVHFISLLRDTHYRREVIETACQVEHALIRSLADQAAALDMPGSLVHTKATAADAAERPRDQPTAKTSRPRPATPAGRSFRMGRLQYASLLGVVFSVMLMGMNAGRIEQLITGNDVEVRGSLHGHVRWTADKAWHLKDLVFVEGGSRLSIEPGTRIFGHPGAALVVTRDATIEARGTAGNPIVFTSAKAPGHRRRGDWGGVVLLGNAPVNTGVEYIEGIDKADPRGAFGGSDVTANCGLLQYVRIEFAGHEIAADNELNGLTLGGCGDATVIRNVQVHMALDDGVELFGGSVALKQLVITRAGDDGLDWDRGWQGRGQFIIVQQDAQTGDSAIEADNYKKDHDAMPRSRPVLSNLTLIGSRSPQRTQRGMVLRHGTGADLRNVLVSGFSGDAVDLRDRAADLVATGELLFNGVLLADALAHGYFADERGDNDDDRGLDEHSYFNAHTGVRFARESLLGNGGYDVQRPNFVPDALSEAVTGAAPVPEGEFWDEAAGFIGAVRPGSRVTWLDGWTAFPEN